MTTFKKSCSVLVKNTGVQQICPDEKKQVKFVVAVPVGQEFATESAAKTEATWQAGLNADGGERWYRIGDFFGIEDQSEDTVFETSSLGKNLKVRDGIKRYQGTIANPGSALIRNLRTHDNIQYDIYEVTVEDVIYGQTPDGVKFKGYKGRLFVSKTSLNDGSVAEKLPVVVEYDSVLETEDRRQFIDPVNDESSPWSPDSSLTSLKDVDVNTVGTPIATEVVVVVTGAYDDVPITGLDETNDIQVYDDTGAVQASSGQSKSDNEYTLTFVGLGAGNYTVDLVKPSSQTNGGYESTEAASFIIP